MSEKNYRSLANLSTVGNYQAETGQFTPSRPQDNGAYYDEKHRKLFSRPALTCELCGYPMDYNGHKLTSWESKWSIHEVCRDKGLRMLDRQSGIARDRNKRKRK